MIELIKEYFSRGLFAVIGALLAFLQPVKALCILVITFIAIDFVVGCLAGRRRALNNGQRWYFQSRKAWRTVEKLAYALVAVVMSFALDTYIIGDPTLYITKSIAGLVCGWEFWSYMENAGDLSEAKFFKVLGRFARKEIEKRTDIDITQVIKEEMKNEDNKE